MYGVSNRFNGRVDSIMLVSCILSARKGNIILSAMQLREDSDRYNRL